MLVGVRMGLGDLFLGRLAGEFTHSGLAVHEASCVLVVVLGCSLVVVLRR